MYRSVTWQAMQLGTDLADEPALQIVAATLPLRFDGENVFINDVDATAAIRTPEVTRNVAAIADAVSVRTKLVELQRRIASTGDFVCEGRDQGTVAFPDAFCKIFLTASPNARAARRADQLKAAGHFVDYDQIVREQETRDQQDESRPIGRLQKADDAIEVNTDHQSIDEVVKTLVRLVQDRLAK
jgi:cytidylate kinase